MNNKLIVTNIEPFLKVRFPEPGLPVIPHHAFNMMLVAPPGSGKTNLLCYMILNMYAGYFHRIVVCSTTIDNDEKWTVVKKKKGLLAENKELDNILTGYAKSQKNKKYKIVFADENEYQEKDEPFDGLIDPKDMFTDIEDIFPILRQQQSTVEMLKHEMGMEDEAKYKADRMLVILDDQAGKFEQSNKSDICNFIIRHRHYSASVIIVTQCYKAIPKTLRTSSSCLVLFDIGNQAELDAIYEERGDRLSKQTWLAIYRHAVDDAPYSFMYYNYKYPKGQRFYKRFEALLTEENQSLITNEQPASTVQLPKADRPPENGHKTDEPADGTATAGKLRKKRKFSQRDGRH